MGMISNVIRNAIKSNDPLNIIVAPYDGIFELSLCNNTHHNFYMLSQFQKLAQSLVHHERLLHLDANIPNWNLSLDFDLIVCNDIVGQINYCNQLSNLLHIPLIIIHHSIKPPFVKKEDIQILKNNNSNNTSVSLHQKINESWYQNFPTFIYDIPIIENVSQEEKILIVGSFNQDQLYLIDYIKNNSKLPVTIKGQDIPITLIETIELMKTHRFFVNLYNDLEINALMLYAMGMGCTVISSPSILNEYFIEHGKNGFMTSSVDTILKLVYLVNPDIGKNAINTIKNYKKQQDFGVIWNNLFYETSKQPFLG